MALSSFLFTCISLQDLKDKAVAGTVREVKYRHGWFLWNRREARYLNRDKTGWVPDEERETSYLHTGSSYYNVFWQTSTSVSLFYFSFRGVLFWLGFQSIATRTSGRMFPEREQEDSSEERDRQRQMLLLSVIDWLLMIVEVLDTTAIWWHKKKVRTNLARWAWMQLWHWDKKNILQ